MSGRGLFWVTYFGGLTLALVIVLALGLSQTQ